jgi:hypothetical protein
MQSKASLKIGCLNGVAAALETPVFFRRAELAS